MLTEEQRRAREGKLTASRVAVLMTGDAEGVLCLYREMIGEEPEPDLSGVWAVRLGEATEQLNLDWLEEHDLALARRGHVIIHPTYDWAACTLDAWAVDLEIPVEAKHVGSREPLEIIVNRYQPQLQWQMECTGANESLLSVIMGANPPVTEYVPRDAEYAAEMMRRGEQFMECVARRIPPVALPAVPPPADATKIVDMTGNQTWERHARQWLQVYGAAQTAKESEKVLKDLVPPDAKKAFGFGVQITRDRVGRLSLRELKQ